MSPPLRIESVSQLPRACRNLSHKARVAIAPCAESFVLRAAVQAAAEGVAEPVLVGDPDATRRVAEADGLDISAFRMIDQPDPEQAVRTAVELYRRGEAGLIMKGLIATATLLKAVLDKEHGVPPEGVLSHVTVFDNPLDGRATFLSDAGVNIKPNLLRKVDILKNALSVARALGVERPRAALLAATEKVNYPAMPSTLDADVISKMAAAGEFGEADVQGPLSLDLALSPVSARCKGMEGPVAGRADVLITPDIEAGNVLYKTLNTLCGATLASVVVGSKVPVVVPSRADTELSKFHSIALAAYLAEAK